MDTYAVITCDEGINIDFDEIEEIVAVLDSVYGDQPFGLIANRENLYSVNPLAIDKLFSRDNLVAGAIVGKAINHAINAAFENTFVSGATIKYFFDMNPAVTWIENMVKKDNVIH
jgi:hypothetical protein